LCDTDHLGIGSHLCTPTITFCLGRKDADSIVYNKVPFLSWRLPNGDLPPFVEIVSADVGALVDINDIGIITQHRLTNIYREIVSVIMAVDQPVSPAINHRSPC
jgi:hypothetical protein